jgi:AraC-like DNA-binding protein
MTDYNQRRALLSGAALLKNTGQPIEWIAKAVGLLDSAALIRIFKKHMGTTPDAIGPTAFDSDPIFSKRP